MKIKIERQWSMPNKFTFQIQPIADLLKEELDGELLVVDPFAGMQNKYATLTNDLNPDAQTDYHLDALDFLSNIKSNSADVVLYDPPYSPRQVSECYHHYGKKVTALDTSARWRKQHLDQIQRILKLGGKAICFGWNTNGVGKTRGFELKRILIVAHGGSHNDTLVTVEKKIKQ